MRLPCLQEVWQATIGEELDCSRELNNRLQRVFLAYVFDTDLVGQVNFLLHLKYISIQYLLGLFRSKEVLGGQVASLQQACSTVVSTSLDHVV